LSITPAESEKLVLDNTGLAYFLAKRKAATLGFQKNGADYDDLAGAALYGLVIASRSFDPTKTNEEGRSIPFSAWAAIKIRGHLCNWVKKKFAASRLRNESDVLCSLTNAKDGGLSTLPDTKTKEPWEIVEGAERLDLIQKAVSPREFNILYRRMSGEHVNVIARDYKDINPNTVGKIARLAIVKLREKNLVGNV